MPTSPESEAYPVIQLAGSWSRKNLPSLQALIRDNDSTHPAVLILNCSSLYYLDSSIIGVLVDTHRRLASEGRKLVLRWLPDNIYRVLESASLHTLFHLETDRRKRNLPNLEELPTAPVLGGLKRCWDLYQCGEHDCVNYGEQVFACWLTPAVPCKSRISASLDTEIAGCVSCEVFKNNVNQLGSIHDNLGAYILQSEAAFARLAGERDTIELNLRNTEKYLDLLFNEATDAVLIVDNETGAIYSSNPTARRILGLDSTQSRNKSFFHFCPELKTPPRPWDNPVLTSDSHHRRWDHQWISESGSRYLFEVTYSPISIPNRSAVLIVGRDVSRDRAAEDGLQKIQQELNLALRELHNLDDRMYRYLTTWHRRSLSHYILQDMLELFATGDAGVVFLFNRAGDFLRAEASIGYDQPELTRLLQFHPGEFIPGFDRKAIWGPSCPDPQPMAIERFDRLWKDLMGRKAEAAHRLFFLGDKDKHRGFLILQSFSDPDAFHSRRTESDRILRMGLGALEKVSRVEEAESLQSVVDAMIESLPSAAFWVDCDGLVRGINQAGLRYLGCGNGEVVGRTLESVQSANTERLPRECLSAFSEGKGWTIEIETEASLHRKVSLSSVPLPLNHKTPWGALVVIQEEIW